MSVVATIASRKRNPSDEIDRVRASFRDWSDEAPLTEAETAAITSLSRPWLKVERQKPDGGRGPRFVRIAGTVRYLAGDVREWLSAQAASGEPNRRGRRG